MKRIIELFAYETKDTVKLAERIAQYFHKGQYRRGEGKPYIVHPRRVASYLETAEEKCIALLHDVVEDTIVELEDLAPFFSEQIIQGIDCLTKVNHNKDATRQKILTAPVNVQRIKLFDVIDNMSTLDAMPAKKIQKKIEECETFYLPLAEKIQEQTIIRELLKHLSTQKGLVSK